MILQGVGVDLSYRPNQFDIYIPCISFPFIPLLLLIFFVWLPFNNCRVKSRVWLRHWRIEFIKHWKENEQRNFWLEIKTMKQFRQSPPPPGPEKVFCFACPSGKCFLDFPCAQNKHYQNWWKLLHMTNFTHYNTLSAKKSALQVLVTWEKTTCKILIQIVFVVVCIMIIVCLF